jgi:hypothetical protein
MNGGNMRRVVLLVAMLGILGALVAGPAQAAPGGPLSNKLICVMSGRITVTTPDATTTDTVSWFLQAGGICTGDARGPYIGKAVGSGVSTDLGFCDDLLIKDLALDVDLDLESISSGLTLHRDQTWFAPLTTFPLATPFFISNQVDVLSGAGSMFTRYGFNCPPGGSPAANFVFAFLRG